MRKTILEKPFASMTETAKRLGCARQTLKKAIKEGQIPALRLNKRLFIPCKWLHEQLGGATRNETTK